MRGEREIGRIADRYAYEIAVDRFGYRAAAAVRSDRGHVDGPNSLAADRLTDRMARRDPRARAANRVGGRRWRRITAKVDQRRDLHARFRQIQRHRISVVVG